MHYDNDTCELPLERGNKALTVVRATLLPPTTWRLPCLLLLILGCVSNGYCTAFCEPCEASWPLNCLCKVTRTAGCSVKCQVHTNYLPNLDNLPQSDATELDLSGNSLTSLEGATLQHFTALKVLKLYDNQLRRIPRRILNSASVVNYISLHGNPWHCDCEILHLKQWMSDKVSKQLSVTDIEETVCHTPLHLEGRKITSINKKDCGDDSGDVLLQDKPSGKRHRRKRDSNDDKCFEELEKKGKLKTKCEATDFGSCVESTEGQVDTIHFQDIKELDTYDVEKCEMWCLEMGYFYQLLYTGDDKHHCFCGKEHATCTDCKQPSSSDDYTNWDDGKKICGSIYHLNGVQQLSVLQLRLDVHPPYSTNVTAILEVSGSSTDTGDYYVDFGDGYGVRTSTSDALNYQYFVGGYYQTSIAITTDLQPNQSLPLTVLDPPLFSDKLVQRLASTTTAVATVVEQGTRVQLLWTRTSGNGKIRQGRYCPDDWTSFRSKCLLTFTDKKSFSNARDECLEEGAHLLSLSDEDELEEFSETVDTTGKHYTGAKLQDNTYTWDDLDTQAFFEALPDESSGEKNKCVIIQNGQLRAFACSDEAVFTCEKDPIECRHGGVYHPFTRQCYLMYSEEAVDWGTAQRGCSELGERDSGGMLAIANTENVQLERTINAAGGSTTDLWLGLRNQNTAREWLWVDGSVANYSGVTLSTNGSEKCVALTADTLDWYLDNCDSQKAYVCQYNAYETVSVPKQFAGSLLSGFNSTPTALDEGEKHSINTSLLYIFTDSMFSHDGILQSWVFEAGTQAEPIEFAFQVYRPESVCSEDSGCAKPVESCPLSEQYCPFSGICQSISEVCTCQTFPDSSLCTASTSVYRLMTETMVHLPEDSMGIQVIKSSSTHVKYGDVIAIQAPETANLPVECLKDEEELRQRPYHITNQSDWIHLNSTVNIADGKQHAAFCKIMAIYTQPVLVEPPLNLRHPAISNYNTDTFHAEVQNSVGNSVIEAEVLIYELQDFRVQHPCQIMQESQNMICAIDKDIEKSLIFRVVSLERDIFLESNVTTESILFSTECPNVDGYVCMQPTKGIFYYAMWPVSSEWYQEDSVMVFATAWTGSINKSLEFAIQPTSKLSNLVLQTNREWVMIGEDIVLTALVNASSEVMWSWNVSGVVLVDEDKSTLNYTTTDTGIHNITVTAQNAISELRDQKQITVFNAGVEKVELFLETVVGDVTLIALLEPYSTGYLEVAMFNASNLFIFFMNENPYQKTINTAFAYQFTSLDTQNITVHILNPVTNATVSTFEQEIVVFQRLVSVNVTINSSVDLMVETDSVTLFSVTCSPVQDTGKVYYTYQFGDWSDTVSSESSELTHEYNESGTYNVTVRVSNNISFIETVFPITVVDPLNGLKIRAKIHNFIGYEAKFRLKLTKGTMVTYYLHNGLNETFTQQLENVFKVVYAEPGIYNVTAIVENPFGKLTASKLVNVHDLDYFELNGIGSDPCVALLKENIFQALVVYHDSSLLTYRWNIAGDDLDINQVYVTHVFNETGYFTLGVNVSSPNNSINASYTNLTVCVEEPLDNLTFTSNVSVIPLTRGSTQSAKVSAILIHGSHYHVEWTYFDTIIKGNSLEQVLVFDTYGVYDVGLMVSNNINTLSQSLNIYVYEIIDGLHAIFNNVIIDRRGSLPSGILLDMAIYTDTGSDLEYSWYSQTVSGVNITELKNTSWDRSVSPSQGEYLVHINVWNPVSSAVLTIELSVQDIIQNLTLLTPSDLYTKQQTEFTASILNGSSVNYHWTLVKHDTTYVFNLTENNATVAHTFLAGGLYKLIVEAKNDVSSMLVEEELTVLDIAYVEMEVNQNNTPYIPTETVVTFSVSLPDYMDNPSYNWTIAESSLGGEKKEEQLVYNFASTGMFRVELFVVQDYFLVRSSLIVYAQEEVENVTITLEDVIDNTFNVYDNITMRLASPRGTNLTYQWDMGNGDMILGQKELSYGYRVSGTYAIRVTVSNNVSKAVVEVTVQVLDKIAGLKLLYCCEEAVRTNTEVFLYAYVKTGTDVEFNWTVYDNSIKELKGQNNTYIFSEPGTYTLVVTAMNGYSQDTFYTTVDVIDPITEVEVEADRPLWNLYYYEESGLDIAFSATASGGEGSWIEYEWFVNQVLQQSGNESVFRFEFKEGFYRVHVIVSNKVSSKNASVTMFQVQKLLCPPPVLTVTSNKNLHEMRSLSLKVEVSVENCKIYETEHQWSVYKSSCESGQQIELPKNVGILTPSLSIPARTLDYGTYCFNMTSSYMRTPASTSIQLTVEVYDTPLQALIAGGSRRVLPNNQTVMLDGTLSYDPDKSHSLIKYHWTCNSWRALVGGHFAKAPELSAQSDNVSDGCFVSSDDAVVLIPAGSLSDSRVYNFTLTASAENRTSTSVSQLIRLRYYAVEVSIDCASCRENNVYAVSNSQHVKLQGMCERCSADAVYKWEVSSENQSVPLNENTTNSGADKPVLSIKNGVLSNGNIYTFSLYVNMILREGLAVLDLTANLPPSGGTCKLKIAKAYVVAMEDMVEISCHDWVDSGQTNSQLIYHIYAMKDSSEWYPIYRGTSSNNTFYLSGEGEVDIVNLHLKVINVKNAEALGLNVSVEVHAPDPGTMSRSAYLFRVGIPSLSVLRYQNKPKALLQYVIALNLQLNAESEKASGNKSDIDKRILLRSEMILIMNGTLTVSAIDDVQQMAYVLMLITTYTDEFPAGIDNYLSVIRLLYSMTTPLRNEVSPGMTGEEFMPQCILAAADNLLQIVSSDVLLSTALYREMSETLQELIKGTLLLKLQTQLVEENQAEYETDNLLARIQHIYAENAAGKVDLGSGQNIEFPQDMLDYLDGEGVYQILTSYSSNPNNWELPNGVAITSQITNVYFTNASTTVINITGLTDPIVTEFRSPVIDTAGKRKRRSTSEDSEQTDVHFVTVGPGESTTSPVSVTNSVAPGSVLHMKFEAFTDNSDQVNVFVTLYIAKGYVATQDNHDLEMDIFVNTEENYTVFLSDNFSSQDEAEMYFMTLSNPSPDVSINTSIQHYVSSCQYYSLSQSRWASEGCTVSQQFTPDTTVCLCSHLAMLGTTFAMAPAQLKFEAHHVGSISPVIFIVVSIMALLFIVMLPLCRHLDKADMQNIRYVPLCGKDGTYKYEVTVVTGRRFSAGTSSNIGIKLFGKSGKSDNKYLERANGFQRNCTDTVLIATHTELGEIDKVLLWHDNTGLDASWYVCRVIVRDLQDNRKYYFIVNNWLSVVKETNCKPGNEIQREILVTDQAKLTSFSTRFTEELCKGLVERHLWVSMIDKPARSYFTRVQRLTCCMTMIFVYMLTNALWYGLTHTAVDYRYKSTYFVWSDIMVGMVTCIAVFLPVIIIIQLFRHSPPKENSNKISAKPGTAETVVMDIDIDGEDSDSIRYSSNRRVLHLPADLSREGSEESSFMTSKPGILKRTGNIHRVAPVIEPPKRSERLPVHSGSSGLWNHENIIKSWPEKVPSQQESRQTSAVSFKNTSRKIHVEGCEDADHLIHELDTFKVSHTRSGHQRRRQNHSAVHSSRGREPSMVDLSMGSMVDMDSYYMTSRDTTSVSFASNHRSRKVSHVSTTSEADSLPGIAEVESTEITAPIVPVYGPNHHMLEDTEEDTDHVQLLPLPPPVRRHCFLPHCCLYLAYILCSMLCLGSVIAVFILARTFGDAISLKWLLATFVSCVFSILLIEPVKVVLVALCMALLTSHLEQCEDQLYFKPILQSNEKLKDTKIKPVGGFSLLHAKEEGKKIRRIKTLIRQVIAYTLFLLLVLILNYATYNQKAFYYTSHIKNTFTKQVFHNTNQFSDIRTYKQYWDWLEEVAAPSLHSWDVHEAAVSGYNIGMVRLRQIRSTSKQCSAENAFIDIIVENLVSQTCYGDPSWAEDKEPYRPAFENGSSWLYSSPDQLHVVGHMETYSGGGYIQLLGQTLNQTLDDISELRSQNWLDRGTRAVFLEWTEYSVGLSLFAVGSILMEFPISGGVIPTVTVQAVDLLDFTGQMNIYMLCEVFLALVFVYLFIMTILNIKESRWRYFKEFWNWMDLVLIVLTLTSVAIYGHATRHCTKVYGSFLENRQEFTSFADSAHWITSWKQVNAVLLFVLMFVVVYQLRFIKFMSKFTRTIHTSCWKLLALAFVLMAFLSFYAQLGYLWYGHVVYAFHEVGLGIPGMLSLYLGDVNSLETMWLCNRAFTLFFVMSFLSLLFICVFGLSLAVLQDSYKAIKAQMLYHSTLETQDYEMVELVIERFKRWIGVKKEKPAFRRVQFLGEASISSRNSSAKTLRSHRPDSSEGSSYIVDEEMEEMMRTEMLERVQVTWNSMMDKLDQVVLQDIEETKLIDRIESQLQCQCPQQTLPPKQPESVDDPSQSPFKVVRPKVRPTVFPFNLPDIAKPPAEKEGDYKLCIYTRKDGPRVESPRNSQPLVPPVSRTRLASSASSYGPEGSTQRGEGMGRLRRPSVITQQHKNTADKTDLTVRHVWEDT